MSATTSVHSEVVLVSIGPVPGIEVKRCAECVFVTGHINGDCIECNPHVEAQPCKNHGNRLTAHVLFITKGISHFRCLECYDHFVIRRCPTTLQRTQHLLVGDLIKNEWRYVCACCYQGK